jgi:hypothetical protein
MKSAEYTWGEYNKEEQITKTDLKQMRRLSRQELMGFAIRKEDKDKAFYASEEYIDSGADGISVKFSYAL